MPPDLLQRFLEHWPDTLSGQCHLELGLSGGVDSMVLLDLLARARRQLGFSLSAVHVHHGLSAHADAWAGVCAGVCAALGVPLRVERVLVAVAGGESLEAVARRERYGVYAASAADAIVLAHHQDDLAETVLLQLLRGGGPRALAAMPVWRVHQGVALWRPLLGFARSEIEAYAAAHSLQWVEDESNADTRWRRNLLRHKILPQVALTMPHYRQHLTRTASLCADAAEILQEVVRHDLAAVLSHGRLNMAVFERLSVPRQRQLLVHWCEQLALGQPAPAALENFRTQLLAAAAAASPQLSLRDGVLVRYRDEVWSFRRARDVSERTLGVLLPGVDSLQEGWAGRLTARMADKGLPAAWLEGGLRLLPRKGGECLVQAVGRKPVKTLLQEAGLPPALRMQWPLLYRGNELVAVPGVAIASDCLETGGWLPEWAPQ
ncbi:tRNA lysidine(34) synthetase TilS [Craterilacuibacter sp.]|uniref:tRNA lysidine(34) synthetase TilS n=1 Tax=Craterilacuibacter sp. TaxID=2870909 RepID=UPI003F354C4A